MNFLKNKSSEELNAISIKAKKLAKELKKEQPSYNLALQNGVKDHSYNTTANGMIESYSGSAIIVMSNGQKWEAIGHGPKGNAYYVDREGYIEFIKL